MRPPRMHACACADTMYMHLYSAFDMHFRHPFFLLFVPEPHPLYLFFSFLFALSFSSLSSRSIRPLW